MSWEGYKKEHLKEWESYLKVAIVRNPWDRFVSCYEYAKMVNSHWHSNDEKESKFGPHPDYSSVKDLTFKDFVHKFSQKEIFLYHQCWTPQHYWICDKDYEIRVDKIFRYEDIDNNEEFKSLFGNIDRINQSPRSEKSYREYYTSDEQKLIVQESYKKDIELFNYSFS